MKKEKGKLVIALDELQKILDYAKNRAEYGDMRNELEIECADDKITVTQHCHYAECNSIYHIR